ncbi:MAG TPA: diguanylate cyclase [Solirubrobacterales bacterium]
MALPLPTTSSSDSREKVWTPSVALLVSRPRVAVAIAAGLFALILVLRFAAGTAGDAVSFLYVVPIAVVAVALGERAGLIAGTAAFILASGWAVREGVDLTPLGYVIRAGVFLLIGDLVGRFATGLRALEAESARHFELSLDMICVAGFDGYFKRVNPAFERILGYSEEDLLGRPFLDFVHPDDRQRTEEEAAAISEGTSTAQFRNRYFDKNGEVHWIEWASQPLPAEEMIYAVARDVTDRKALEQELQRLSHHDSLTGLFNRRRFEEELRRQLAYTRRYGSGGALLVIDVDRFKQINDSLGHAAGDRALCQVAALLRDNLRGSDVVARDPELRTRREGDGIGAEPDPEAVLARLGGDEFVVLLPEVEERGAQAVAERLARTVRESVLRVEGQEIHLEISVGVALFDEYGRPGELELLAAADRAMYAVKAAGGDGATVVAVGG